MTNSEIQRVVITNPSNEMPPTNGKSVEEIVEEALGQGVVESLKQPSLVIGDVDHPDYWIRYLAALVSLKGLPGLPTIVPARLYEEIFEQIPNIRTSTNPFAQLLSNPKLVRTKEFKELLARDSFLKMLCNMIDGCPTVTSYAQGHYILSRNLTVDPKAEEKERRLADIVKAAQGYGYTESELALITQIHRLTKTMGLTDKRVLGLEYGPSGNVNKTVRFIRNVGMDFVAYVLVEGNFRALAEAVESLEQVKGVTGGGAIKNSIRVDYANQDFTKSPRYKDWINYCRTENIPVVVACFGHTFCNNHLMNTLLAMMRDGDYGIIAFNSSNYKPSKGQTHESILKEAYGDENTKTMATYGLFSFGFSPAQIPLLNPNPTVITDTELPYWINKDGKIESVRIPYMYRLRHIPSQPMTIDGLIDVEVDHRNEFHSFTSMNPSVQNVRDMLSKIPGLEYADHLLDKESGVCIVGFKINRGKLPRYNHT